VVIASGFSRHLLAHPVLYNTVEMRLCYFVVSLGSKGPDHRTGRKRLDNRNVRWIRGYHVSFINPLNPSSLCAISFHHRRIQHSTHTVYLCVLCGSQNKQLLYLFSLLHRACCRVTHYYTNYCTYIKSQSTECTYIKSQSAECTFVAGHSSQHNITQNGMLPQHPTYTTKLICDYF